jgi:hypothetical protein
VNSVTEIRKIVLAPYRSDSHPDNGITAAWASIYPVTVHCSVGRSASNSCTKLDKATFIAVESNTTMNTPAIIAISGAKMDLILKSGCRLLGLPGMDVELIQ